MRAPLKVHVEQQPDTLSTYTIVVEGYPGALRNATPAGLEPRPFRLSDGREFTLVSHYEQGLTLVMQGCNGVGLEFEGVLYRELRFTHERRDGAHGVEMTDGTLL